MLIAIISYLGILTVGLASIIFRRQVILLTGRTFLITNAVFVAALAVVFLLRLASVQELTIGWFFIFLLAFSFVLRRAWLFFFYSRAHVSGILEDSMSRILLDYRRQPEGYVLVGRGGEEARLRMTPLPLGCAILFFQDPAHWKKVRVLQDLLRKNFAGVFPKLVIRL
jgi:hypothetical protein